MSATQKMIDELAQQNALAAKLDREVVTLGVAILDLRWPLTTEARANVKEARRLLKRLLKELKFSQSK